MATTKDLLSTLPPELIALILQYLPVQSLLTFSATSRTNRMLTQESFSTLRLAVFSKKIYASLAFLSSMEEHESLHTVSRIYNMPKDSSRNANPAIFLREAISLQNTLILDALGSKMACNLRHLSLAMHNLQLQALGEAMGQNLSKLKSLEIRCYHPFAHENYLSQSYWQEAPSGSTSWNPLVGLGQKFQKQLRLRNLEKLTIERAGITSAQLRTFVKSNPCLKTLYLNNVTGADLEFVQWMSSRCKSGSILESVTMENCPALKMQGEEDFEWLRDLENTSIRRICLAGCRNINGRRLQDIIRRDRDKMSWLKHLTSFVAPYGDEFQHGKPVSHRQSPEIVLEATKLPFFPQPDYKIEVDPAYLSVAVAA